MIAAILLLLAGDEKRTDGELRFEPSINISVEFWPAANDPIGGISFDDAFFPGAAVDGQLGLAYYWTPGHADFDLMIRPFAGYAYRQFSGHQSTSSAGIAIRPDSMIIQTLYGGVSLGIGQLPEGDEFGFFVYVSGQAGQAYHDNTMAAAPALYAGRRELFDESTEMYWSGGLGVEVRKKWVGVHVEIGYRSFGKVRQGSGPIAIQETDSGVLYLVVGATFSF